MAWAALIPVAASLIGSMTKKDSPAQGAPGAAPPSLGEIFSANAAAANQAPSQAFSPFTPSATIKTGGGFNG